MNKCEPYKQVLTAVQHESLLDSVGHYSHLISFLFRNTLYLSQQWDKRSSSSYNKNNNNKEATE